MNSLRLVDRRSGAVLAFPGVSFQVTRATWSIDGGPAAAEVVASGPAARLGQLTQVLRAGAVLCDGSGAPVWWGYVHALDLNTDGLRLQFSLDELFNRVAVRYRDDRINPEVNVGWQFQTAWQQDNNSVTEYGKKEGIFVRPIGFPGEASAYATSLLAKYRRPGLRSSLRDQAAAASSEASAVLQLRGWWDTLAWQFFSEARGWAGFNGGGGVNLLGNVAANTQVAGSFTVGASGWSVISGWVKVARYGAPGDNVTLAIYSNAAGAPNASLGAASVAASTLTGDIGWVRFNLGSAIALTAGTTYWVVVSRSGALDVNNFYRVAVDEGLGYSGGALKLWNGGAWVNRVPDADLVFSVNGQSVTTDQVKVMADPSAGGGQFLKGVYVLDASAVNAWQYRDGKNDCLAEIKSMLAMGTSTGERLQGLVNVDRWLIVRKVGVSSSPDYVVLPSGELRDKSGGRVSDISSVVGKWARVQGLDQGGGDSSAAGAVLLTGAVWDGESLRVKWERPPTCPRPLLQRPVAKRRGLAGELDF